MTVRSIHTASLASMAAFILCGGVAHARGPFVGALPNGSVNSCRTCHTESAGGSPLNAFGRLTAMREGADAGMAGTLDWPAWSRVDSDNDGFTNGQELGDPCGTWTPGVADPVITTVGNPGESSSVPVGAPAACTDDGATSSSGGGRAGPGCGNASLAPAGASALLAWAWLASARRRRSAR